MRFFPIILLLLAICYLNIPKLMLCGNSVSFIYTHVNQYPICQKKNTLLTKKSYRCKSNRMLLLQLILQFHPKLHKILMSRVMNHAENSLLKNIGTISKIFWNLFRKDVSFVFLKCQHLMQNYRLCPKLINVYTKKFLAKLYVPKQIVPTALIRELLLVLPFFGKFSLNLRCLYNWLANHYYKQCNILSNWVKKSH